MLGSAGGRWKRTQGVPRQRPTRLPRRIYLEPHLTDGRRSGRRTSADIPCSGRMASQMGGHGNDSNYNDMTRRGIRRLV
jgi:hypothetical protein